MQHGTTASNLPSQVPIHSLVERSNAAWSALLRGTTSRRTNRVLNPGLDPDPNPESCTLPLDQLAATKQTQDGFENDYSRLYEQPSLCQKVYDLSEILESKDIKLYLHMDSH